MRPRRRVDEPGERAVTAIHSSDVADRRAMKWQVDVLGRRRHGRNGFLRAGGQVLVEL